MTMKAHTDYIIFGRPPIGGKLPLPSPLAAPLPAVHTFTMDPPLLQRVTERMDAGHARR